MFMKILFINSMKAKEFGGGEKWMIQSARGLQERNHTVIIAGKKNSVILKEATKVNIKTTVLDIKWDISPFMTFKIALFLKKNKIDVLICNFNKDLRVAGLAAKIVKTPLVLARHGVVLCKNKWKYKFPLTRFADGIITNTKSIKKIYNGYHWFADDFIEVVYNGIEDKSSVSPYYYGAEYTGKKIILSAGRLTHQKGFFYLIEAAELLKKKRDDFVIIIAGEGALHNELQQQINKYGLQNHVILKGFINNLDMYIKGCDLVVLCSIHEGMPNVLMEAMALAKPVIATDVNGVAELVSDGKTGIIVPSRDSNAIANAIELLLGDTGLRNKYGENGFRRVQRYFTYSAMINSLETYLIKKLNEKRKEQGYS
jgi:glycosyltransferase involved in cell wall biosynthesis